jgi:DNA-directed RNA polymerase subunit RPC12/RpoP
MLREIVRCPYCVLGNEFRPMYCPTTGRAKKFVCINCGHTTTPDAPRSTCACPRCQEVIRLASQRRSAEELRRSAGA